MSEQENQDQKIKDFYARMCAVLGIEAARRIPSKDWEMTYVQEFTKGTPRLVFFFSEKRLTKDFKKS